jgi:hypothetical protein
LNGVIDGVEGPLYVFSQNWLTIAALALALVALLVAFIVLVRKPEVRVRATEALSGTIKAVTQPFALDRKMRGHEAARARLVLVEGNANVPPVIEIRSSNTRIGRDPGLSNVVVDDPRVSRYHCRIAEEADGSYRIFDEGSTSGTYVNYEPVPIAGQFLQDGDQIHIGPVGLRFELLKGDGETTQDASKTEPYVPQFDKTIEEDPFKTEPFKIQPPERKSGQ